jgi:quinoprotein glucose dehydrogenase
MSTARRFARLIGSLVIGHSGLVHAADIAAAAAGTSTNGFKPLVKDDRPATPILAPASNEGEVRIKQFKLTQGLKVDLWAAEPMLANPVAFSVDEKGRVFTSETYRYRTSVLDIRHYMFMLEDDLAARSLEDRLAQIRKWFGPEGERALSNETEVIRLLEDTNGDHKADKSSIFADGFTSPLSGIASGVLARNGEVWFTEIPSLWRFRPATTSEAATMARDKTSLTVTKTPNPKEAVLRSLPHVHGKNLVAEELLRGFGIRFSFTGHDLHGLKFGPDGRLYFSCGDRGAHIVTQEGTIIDLPDEGAVFRCEPDGSKLEVVHRGLRNPQELAFNEYGDLFTGDNDSDQGDRERWVQVIEGADSGWRVGHQHAPLGNAGMWNMERLWVPHFEGQAAYLMPPIANLGDGPSGLVYDYGTSLPEELKGRFLLAYFKGTSAKSGLYSLKVRPAGAGYELVAHDEFVWNSLVPDVDLAPDGSIFFADWHEGWPKSNKGRLYRAYFPGVIADPVVLETAKLLGEGFAKRSEKELLGLLAHRDMRVRQEAQFELAARGPKSFDGLKKVAFESKNQFARLHAIRSLAQIGRKTPTTQLAAEFESLIPLWEETDPQVRVEAARLFAEALIFHAIEQPVYGSAADHLKGKASGYRDPLYQLAKGDPSPAVRRAALDAIGRFAGAFHRVSYRRTRHPALQVRDALTDGPPQSSQGGPPNQLVNPGPDIATMLTKHPVDAVLLNAAANALASVEANLHFGLDRFTKSSDRTLRLAGLLTQRRLADKGVATALSDPDPLLVLEAARAINDVPITNALPALAALAEPAKLDALLKQFAALPRSGTGFQPVSGASSPSAGPDGLEARQTGRMPVPLAIRDVRADQPLPWTNAPVDHLTPMLLRVVNANFRVGTAESARRLAVLATRTDLPELIRTEALFALGTWAQPHPRDRIVGTYRPLPERDAQPAREALGKVLPQLVAAEVTRQTGDQPAANPPPHVGGYNEPLLIATTEAVARLKLTDAAPRLVAVVKDSAAPANARAAALRAFSQIESRKSEVEHLLAFAAQDSAEPLRLAASKLSAELNPNDAGGQLAAKLTAGSLAEQQSAFASLGDLKSDAADAILAEWMDKLMKREVANEVMLDLVEAAAKRSAGAVKSRLETYAKWKLPQDHLTPYREALFGGDAARGRKIFYENPAVACTRCHHIGNDGGGNAGPVLDGLAGRVTREHLLESIVFPNQQVTQGFETAMLSLKNGTAYAGIVKAESDTELTLLTPEDGELKLKKADITSRDKGLSGMPEGFGQLLNRQELRDVIEFLGTLK